MKTRKILRLASIQVWTEPGLLHQLYVRHPQVACIKQSQAGWWAFHIAGILVHCHLLLFTQLQGSKFSDFVVSVNSDRMDKLLKWTLAKKKKNHRKPHINNVNKVSTHPTQQAAEPVLSCSGCKCALWSFVARDVRWKTTAISCERTSCQNTFMKLMCDMNDLPVLDDESPLIAIVPCNPCSRALGSHGDKPFM